MRRLAYEEHYVTRVSNSKPTQETVMEDKDQSKVITEFNIISDEITPKDEFLEDQKSCKLCGGELLYTHVTNFIGDYVDEKAHCSLCSIKHTDTVHCLQ
ncbi:hypothetical protein N9W41_00185 [bacterium]|nr:hypothetical protein [bacterium]